MAINLSDVALVALKSTSGASGVVVTVVVVVAANVFIISEMLIVFKSFK